MFVPMTARARRRRERRAEYLPPDRGALAVAIFGALIAQPGGFLSGMRISLAIAATLPLATASASLLLRAAGRSRELKLPA